jgi:hypothetical protein
LPSEDAVYVLLSSSDVAASAFCTSNCGWHQHGPIDGVNVKYAWIGDPTTCAACQPANLQPDEFLWWTNGGDKAPNNLVVDSMASVVSARISAAPVF